MQGRTGAGPLIGQLQKVIKDTLSAIIPVGPLALVDYPDHSNVGDSAIWLGEIAYLERELHVRPSYYCALRDYSASALKNSLPEGPILIHGGGNFGALWPTHQNFRIALMEQFPGRPIIQLPQSIHFASDASAVQTAAAIRKHGAFTLLVRDRPSYDFATAKFDCPVHLCPDMAFYIGQTVRQPSIVDLLFLMRTDKEQVGDLRVPETHQTKIVVDWLTESHCQRSLARLAGRACSALSGGRGAAQRAAIYNLLAWNRYRRGVKILSQGKVVVTDRLHAHIMSTLLNIPHVALDNSYQKLGNFIDAWTQNFEGLRQATAMNEALDQARTLLWTPRLRA